MTSAFPSELMNQGNDVAPEGTDVEPNSIVPTAASPFYGALEASSLCGLPDVARPAGFGVCASFKPRDKFGERVALADTLSSSIGPHIARFADT